MDAYVLIFIIGFLLGFLVFWRPANHKLYFKLEEIMATLDELVGAVTDETSVAESLVTLTYQIKVLLDQALSGQLTPEQQAKIDAVFNNIVTEKEKIAKAVTDNTPQANP